MLKFNIDKVDLWKTMIKEFTDYNQQTIYYTKVSF